MKVLVCIPCLMTGGTEIQTLNLVEALVAAGHDVVTVCYFEFSQDMVDRYRQSGSVVELLSGDGVRPVGIKNTVSCLYSGLRRVVTRHKPDAAHVQYMAPGVIPIAVLRLLGVKRIVATAHTAADIYKSLRLLHFVAANILTVFQCITLRAERSFFGEAVLYTNGMPLRHRGNHFTIYNNLPKYIKIADKPKTFDGSVTIGVVSRLEHIKGMDLVVPAFAEVCGEYGDSRLLVVGDGTLRGDMERQVAELGLCDRVEFAGRQPQSVLQAYYDRIDILLMPSRSEGFGLTAIEGMARGCIVVAADTGGLPEVVTEEAGVLHRIADSADMAAKIRNLLADRARMARISGCAVTRASEFSAERYMASIKDLYSRL